VAYTAWLVSSGNAICEVATLLLLLVALARLG